MVLVKQLHEVEVIIGRLTTAMILAITLAVVSVLFGVTFKTAEVPCQERARRVLITVPLAAGALGPLDTPAAARAALARHATDALVRPLGLSLHHRPLPTVERVRVMRVDFEEKLSAHRLQLFELAYSEHAERVWAERSNSTGSAAKDGEKSEEKHAEDEGKKQQKKDGGDATSGDARLFTYLLQQEKTAGLCDDNQLDMAPSYNVDLDELHQGFTALVVPHKVSRREAETVASETAKAAVPDHHHGGTKKERGEAKEASNDGGMQHHKGAANTFVIEGEDETVERLLVRRSVLHTRTRRPLETVGDLVASFPSLRAIKAGAKGSTTTRAGESILVVRDGVAVMLENGARAPITIAAVAWKGGAALLLESHATESHTFRQLAQVLADSFSASGKLRTDCKEGCFSPLPLLPRSTHF